MYNNNNNNGRITLKLLLVRHFPLSSINDDDKIKVIKWDYARGGGGG